MRAYLGNILHILDKSGESPRLSVTRDGALLCSDEGRVHEILPASEARKKVGKDEIVDYGSHWIMPGFVDTHVHYPQLNIIGSYGAELLEWLETFTFPEEIKFSDPAYAAQIANLFCQTLLQNGTTTAAVFGTSHLEATQILHDAMQGHGLSGWVGKSSMDRNAPSELIVNMETDLFEIEELRATFQPDRTHIHLALTPRYAPSCSDEHLRALGEMKNKHPELKIQTHYAENTDELKWVKELFPNYSDYLDVYERNGLLTEDTLLAHAIHVTDKDCRHLSERKVSISHCPSSNLFLGSGLFPSYRFSDMNIPISLGTDVGAGTSFSMWKTMCEAYKIQKIQGHSLSPATLLYLATLGGAKCLGMEKEIGNFTKGKLANFQVLDPSKCPLLSSRIKTCVSDEDFLFSLITLADDRVLVQTNVSLGT